MPSPFSIGLPFIALQQVESTNNYAIGLVHAAMAQHGAVVFAHHQTQGRGQREKQWLSEPGKNIALSIIIKPALALSQSFLLSMAVAVAAQKLLCSYAGEEVRIKWPNDIYWRDRKAAGILIENVVQGKQIKWCIVGIGINVNQTEFEKSATRAVSLKQITGKEFEPIVLAKEFCHYLELAYHELSCNQQGIVDQYQRLLYKLGETVRLKKGPRVFSALIKKVTNHGELVVQTGVEETFTVGEVEWLI